MSTAAANLNSAPALLFAGRKRAAAAAAAAATAADRNDDTKATRRRARARATDGVLWLALITTPAT